MALPERTGRLGPDRAALAEQSGSSSGRSGRAGPAVWGVSALPPKCCCGRLALGFSHDAWSQAVRPVFGEQGCSSHRSQVRTGPYRRSALMAPGAAADGGGGGSSGGL